jgi:hypothetical protein
VTKTKTIAMTVQLGAARQTWPVKLETIEPHGHYRLSLRSPAGVTWSAEAGDIFGCLIELREQVEPEGLMLCCNGARRDADMSGMLADMGEGRQVYLLDGVSISERPPKVETLAPAPCEMVVSVDEQLRWLDDWWEQNAPDPPE